MFGVVSCVCILSLHVRKVPRLHRSGIEADQRTVVSADRTELQPMAIEFYMAGHFVRFFFQFCCPVVD